MGRGHFVLLVLEDLRCQAIHVSNDYSLDLSYLTTALDVPGYSLFLVSPSMIQRLPKTGKFTFPKAFVLYPLSFRVQMLPSEYHSLILRIDVKTNIGLPMSQICVSFPHGYATDVNNVLQMVKKSYFFTPVTAKVIFDSKKPKTIDCLIQNFLPVFQRANMSLYFEADKDTVAACQRRSMIIDELVSTEESYVDLLQKAHENLTPAFFESSGAPDGLYERSFRSFGEIIPMHQAFLKSLQPMRNSLEAPIGKLFLDFIPYFKVSSPHVSNIRKASDEIIHLMITQPVFVSRVTAICEASLHGLTLESVLIAPMQRLMRYPLLIKELLGATPPTHWDMQDLRDAYSLSLEVSRALDEKKLEQEQIDNLAKLNSSLGSYRNILAPHRKLLLSRASINNKTKIHLMNDILLVQSPESIREFSLQKTIFSCSGKTLIGESTVIGDFESVSEIVSSISTARRRLLVNMGSFGHALVWKQFCETKEILAECCLCVHKSEIYVFSDKLYHLTEASFEPIETKNCPKSRRGASLVTAGDNLLLFGGVPEGYLASYDVAKKTWNRLDYGYTPKQRSKHSAVYSNGYMWIFGGIDASGNLLNDLWSYNVSHGVWAQKATPIAPSPRAGSCMFKYDKFLALCGGDLWFLDESSASWFPADIECSSERSGGICGVCAGQVFLVGGTGSSKHMPAMRLGAGIWESIAEADEPLDLENYSGTYSEDHGFIFVGIKDKKTYAYRVPVGVQVSNGKRRNAREAIPLAIRNGFSLSKPIFDPTSRTITYSVNQRDSRFACSIEYKEENAKLIVDTSHRTPIWSKSSVFMYEGMEPLHEEDFEKKTVFTL